MPDPEAFAAFLKDYVPSYVGTDAGTGLGVMLAAAWDAAVDYEHGRASNIIRRQINQYRKNAIDDPAAKYLYDQLAESLAGIESLFIRYPEQGR